MRFRPPVRPPVRPRFDHKYRCRSYRFVAWQKVKLDISFRTFHGIRCFTLPNYTTIRKHTGVHSNGFPLRNIPEVPSTNESDAWRPGGRSGGARAALPTVAKDARASASHSTTPCAALHNIYQLQQRRGLQQQQKTRTAPSVPAVN